MSCHTGNKQRAAEFPQRRVGSRRKPQASVQEYRRYKSGRENMIVTDIRGCARCGQNHRKLTFTPLTHPIEAVEAWTHWCPCPTNGEPILLTITAKDAYNQHQAFKAVTTGKHLSPHQELRP